MGRQTFKKVITTPEVMEKINPKNKKLQKTFLKEKSRKCSDATLVQYESALNIFFAWNVIEGENKFYPEIKKIEISQFFDYILEELKVNGKRFAFFKSVLSGLSDCVIKLYDEEYPTFRNFISAIIENVPKPDVREKTVWTEEDIDNLLEDLLKKNKIQDACLAALAFYSGMRISELVQVKMDWISEDSTAYSGLFYETPKMRTKGAGKQGKVISRLIIKDLFKPYYDKWVEERKKILEKKKVEDHGFMFINKQGQPASMEVLRGICAKWETIIGKTSYIHSARHAYTTLLKSKYKCSDEFVKTVVRWSSIDLVSTYNDMSEDEIEWEEVENIKNMINKDKNKSKSE